MSTEMAEACGSCYRSYLPSRKINESLKCACQRPFFSQTVARNNLPTDRDCWIEVPKRFVRHYSSLFGETVNFEGDDGRSYCCALVGSDIAIVGYGFEWYDFASSHNVCMGDQVVFTLMEKSRFLVQVYRANPIFPPTATAEVEPTQTVPFAVKVEKDIDVQVAGAQDWLLAKARRSGTNISRSDLTADVDRVPWEAFGGKATRAPEINDEIDVKTPSSRVVYLRRNADERKGSNRGVADILKKTVGLSSTSSPLVKSTTDGQFVQPKATKESEHAESEDAEASSSSTSDSDWSLRGSKREMFDSRKGSRQNDIMEDNCETSGATTSADSMTEEEELKNSSRMKRDFLPSRNRPESSSRRGKTTDGSISEGTLGGDDGKRSTGSPCLFVPQRVNKVHHWAEPGTTRRRTYVSKRGPITRAERVRVFEAARACPITYNSYLRQLEKDNCYRALILAIPAPWCRENMPQTKNLYKGTLVDVEGNSWQTRIRGTEIFWGNFTLDHYLEEDDVVVMELVDSRLESLKFLVHIFRVVDVRMTLTGKAGWAVHYNIVEGIKKEEAHRQFLKAQGKGRLKRKRARGSSHSKISNPADLAVETSHRRLTRRGRSQAALRSFKEISADAIHKTVYAEHDSEDSLPLEYARDSNDGGPVPSETDIRSKFAKVLPREVKVEYLN